jgi:hypothetical protein
VSPPVPCPYLPLPSLAHGPWPALVTPRQVNPTSHRQKAVERASFQSTKVSSVQLDHFDSQVICLATDRTTPHTLHFGPSCIIMYFNGSTMSAPCPTTLEAEPSGLDRVTAVVTGFTILSCPCSLLPGLRSGIGQGLLFAFQLLSIRTSRLRYGARQSQFKKQALA